MTRSTKRQKAYGFGNPLQDLNPLPVLANRNPLPSDVGFAINTDWININTNDIWKLTSVAGGAANWEPIGQDTGGGAPITEYVVAQDGSGDYATIQAACDAVNASGQVGLVYIRGNSTTYTENLTLYDNLILEGDDIQTNITGVHTPPATGAVIFKNLYLISATDVITSAAAGTTRLRFFNCTFNCTNGYVVDCASWTGPVDMFTCQTASTADGVVRVGASTVAIRDSFVGAGANELSITGGTLAIANSRIPCPISPAGANAGSITQGSFIGGTITVAGTSAMLVSDSLISSGVNAAVTQSSAGVVTLSNLTVTSSANPCITGAGAGTVTFSDVNFTSNSAIAATLTVAYVAETRSTKLICGDDTYRVNTFGVNDSVIQAFADDITETGGSTLNAITGSMVVTSGDGSHTPDAIEGELTAEAGSNLLQGMGVHGAVTQLDGSVVGSTFVGTEGEITISETDVGDLPQIYAFGVKGYYRTDDAAAVPAAGEYAGVGSVVEYTTPLDGYGYGVVATRLGPGAGTAARAAFGVAQGTNAAPDWLYGLDLYNEATNAAQPYTNADVRFFNESIAFSAATGVEFSGDFAARTFSSTNTDLTFSSNPVLQSNANTGAAPTGATGDINTLSCQEGAVMEEFIIGAGQTIIAPRMEADGLLISLDLIATEGVEYNFGVLTSSRHRFLIGTSADFFFEAKFKVADVSGCEPIYMGFRTAGANDANYVNYNDVAGLGIITAQNADLITIADRQGAGVTYTNSTDAYTDGQVHTLRVNVTTGGVVTYLIDGVAPGATNAYTFTDAITVMPYISLLHAAVAPGAIHLQSIKAGFSAWN